MSVHALPPQKWISELKAKLDGPAACAAWLAQVGGISLDDARAMLGGRGWDAFKQLMVEEFAGGKSKRDCATNYIKEEREKKRVYEQTARLTWPGNPEPLDYPQPDFPTDVLPQWLWDYSAAVAEAVQAPVSVPAMLGLGCVAGALAKKVRVRAGDWVEHVCLYIMLAMESSAGKSTVFNHMFFPMRDHQARLREKAKPELAKLITRRKTLATQIAHAQKTASLKLDDPQDRARWEREAEKLAVELDELPEAVAPLLIAENTTPEPLATNVLQQGRITIASAEGGELVQIWAGRYSQEPNVGIYLCGYTGDHITIHRRGLEEIIQEPIITIVTTVQPGVLREVVGNTHFKSRGLLGRLLMIHPKSMLGSRQFDRDLIPPTYRECYNTCMIDLLESEERELSVSPAAMNVLREIAEEIEPELNLLTGNLASMHEFAGRSSGHVMRVAALLQLAERQTNQIEEPAMKKAARLYRGFLLPHSRRTHRILDIDEKVVAAKKAMARIQKEGWVEFTGRDLHQKLRTTRSLFGTREQVDDVLRTLEEFKHIQMIPGGKDRWAVHPKLREEA